MIMFYVDNDDENTTMIVHLDDEFFEVFVNYLKLDVKRTLKNEPYGFITPSDLRQKIQDLPHEWLLQQEERKQYVNGKLIIVKTRLTEKYIRELKSDFLRMAKIAEKKKCLIRWE